GVPGRMNLGQVLELHLGWAADRLGFRAITPVFDGATEDDIRAELGRAWLMDHAWNEITARAWEWIKQYDYPDEELEDDDEVRKLYVHAWLQDTPRYDAQRLLESRVYRRRAVLAEWLREKGYEPDDILMFGTDAPSEIEHRQRIESYAIAVSLREWISANDPKAKLADDATTEDLYQAANRVMFATGKPVPHYGKMTLYD